MAPQLIFKPTNFVKNSELAYSTLYRVTDVNPVKEQGYTRVNAYIVAQFHILTETWFFNAESETKDSFSFLVVNKKLKVNEGSFRGNYIWRTHFPDVTKINKKKEVESDNMDYHFYDEDALTLKTFGNMLPFLRDWQEEAYEAHKRRKNLKVGLKVSAQFMDKSKLSISDISDFNFCRADYNERNSTTMDEVVLNGKLMDANQNLLKLAESAEPQSKKTKIDDNMSCC